MPGKRLFNSSLIRTTFTELVANSGEFLGDWDGLAEARPIPVKLIGNSWWQGSYDNISFVDKIEDDHEYLRISTDGGVEWIVFKVSSCNGSEETKYEDIAFEFADITGTAQSYTLDIKASFAYTITRVILETDNSVSGSVSGGSTSIPYTNVGTIQDIAANSTVAIGDRIYLNLDAGHSATTIRGKLVIQRS